MELRKRTSTFARIFVSALALSAIIIVSFATITYALLERSLEKSVERILSNSAEVFAGFIEADVPEKSLEECAKHFEESAGIRTTIIESNGRVILDSIADSSTMENHLSRREVKAAIHGKKAYAQRFSDTLKSRMIYIALPAGKNEEGAPKYCVRQAAPLEDIAKSKRYFLTEILIIGGISILIAGAISWLIARGISRPLRKLTATAVEYSQGNFDVSVPHSDIDEIETLGDSLRNMAFELKRKISSLKKRNCELDEIFGHMSECVFICTSTGEIRRVNRACESIFHVKEGRQLAAEAFRNSEIISQIEAVFSTGKPISKVIEIDENKVYVLDGIPLPYESKRGRALFVLRDISIEKQSERLRREFVTGVSHELKTPITAVKMTAETITDMENDPTKLHFLSIIARESDRMEALVGDMLLLSRIEFTEKSASKNFIEFEIETLLKEAVSAHESEAKERDDSITISSPKYAVMFADFTLSQIALSNLIGNAIRYGGKGCKIEIQAYIDKYYTTIAVKDTGVGISKEDQKRIFERFYRVDKGRSRALGGTGLGLAVVKHIAILHGGKAEVSSELGKGSVFTITFANRNGRSNENINS